MEDSTAPCFSPCSALRGILLFTRHRREYLYLKSSHKHPQLLPRTTTGPWFSFVPHASALPRGRPGQAAPVSRLPRGPAGPPSPPLPPPRLQPPPPSPPPRRRVAPTTMAGLPPDATLTVRWRAATHPIALAGLPQPPTVGGLKAALAAATGVPAAAQTLLWPRRPGGGRGGGGRGGAPADATLLADVFGGGVPTKPLSMMGAPAGAAAAAATAAAAAEAAAAGTSGGGRRGGGHGGGGGNGGGAPPAPPGGGADVRALHAAVVDDLDGLQAPPPPPAPRVPRGVHPFYRRRGGGRVASAANAAAALAAEEAGLFLDGRVDAMADGGGAGGAAAPDAGVVADPPPAGGGHRDGDGDGDGDGGGGGGGRARF